MGFFPIEDSENGNKCVDSTTTPTPKEAGFGNVGGFGGHFKGYYSGDYKAYIRASKRGLGGLDF